MTLRRSCILDGGFFGAGVLCLGIILFGESKLLNSIIESSTNKRLVMPNLSCIFGALLIGIGILNYSNFAKLRSRCAKWLNRNCGR